MTQAHVPTGNIVTSIDVRPASKLHATAGAVIEVLLLTINDLHSFHDDAPDSS